MGTHWRTDGCCGFLQDKEHWLWGNVKWQISLLISFLCVPELCCSESGCYSGRLVVLFRLGLQCCAWLLWAQQCSDSSRECSCRCWKATVDFLLFLLKHRKVSHRLAAAFHLCTCLPKQLFSTASTDGVTAADVTVIMALSLLKRVAKHTGRSRGFDLLVGCIYCHLSARRVGK